MEQRSELYFTTGEFAGILGVTKHTLFHYDEIGLFSPAIKEDNGYRYYFVWQMDVFEVIRGLQKLGMPLGEIKEYMENRSPQRFLSLMGQQEQRIDQEIRRLRNMKKFIRYEIESTEAALKTPLNQPRMIRCPEVYLLVSDVHGNGEKKLAVEIAEHMKLRERHMAGTTTVGTISLGTDLSRGIYDRYVQVYTNLDRKIPGLRTVKRPGGDYIEVCYDGFSNGLERPYAMITRFAEQEQLKLDDAWYEDFLLDELTVKGYENYITRAIVRVLEP